MQLRIKSRNVVADDIIAIELVSPTGAELPAFTAGAHIDLHLGNGINRSYSLVNDPAERHRYVVAVNKDPASRGGSKYVHEQLLEGHELEITGPRNNFELVESAPQTVLVAGGIGVTPLFCMVQRLEALGQPWQLFYGARNRAKAAYLADILALEAKHPGRVHVHINDERNGEVLDINAAVATAGKDAHLYCCGPKPMLDAFLKATGDRPEGHAHVEFFSASQEAATEGGYLVELKRSGKTFKVPQGKSILNVLRDAGLDVMYSCEEGVCGSCETSVLEGDIDHRDSYLTPFEQKAGKKMMICCSGCKGDKLVLDI